MLQKVTNSTSKDKLETTLREQGRRTKEIRDEWRLATWNVRGVSGKEVELSMEAWKKKGKGECVLEGGDFNGRVGRNFQTAQGSIGGEGEEVKNNNGERLIHFCIENRYAITNTFFKHKDIHRYTREVKSRNERSIIDYVIVPKQQRSAVKDVRVKRGSEIFSDHYLFVARIKSGQNIKNGKKFIERKVRFESIKIHKLREEETAQKFRNLVEQKIGEIYDQVADWTTERTWQALKEILLEAARRVCGVSKINKSMQQTAWWTREIKELLKEKKKKWKEYLHKKTVHAYNEYKALRKKVKDLVSQAKVKSWENFGNQMEENSQGSQKLFYSIVNPTRQKRPYSSGSIKDKEGDTLTEVENVQARWRQYFQELLCTEDSGKQDQYNRIDICNDTETIDMDELSEVIQKIKIGKAAGHDSIKPETLKCLGPKGRALLLSLYLKVWESGVVPKDWEVGVIIPIWKKGDSRNCENYRGITLLSIVAKVFERILESKLKSKVERELLDSQSGFRKGFSTQDHTFTIKQARKSYSVCERYFVAEDKYPKINPGRYPKLRDDAHPVLFYLLQRTKYQELLGQLRRLWHR
nr:unnamed protein product [Callosobruchus analis]